MENTPSTTQAPSSSAPNYQYAGFWIRVLAAIIDGIIVSLIASILGLNNSVIVMNGTYPMSSGMPMMVANAGGGHLVLDLLYVLGFWIWKSATPGKMILGLTIVQTDGVPLTWQKAIVRYIGQIISIIPFGLGFLWVAFDSQKQGWHDKLAGTYVIKTK